MVLELHVWGPAFGLPSIDAECLAAIALLNTWLNLDEWLLVAAHDQTSGPTHDFPVLRDGDKWVGGYNNIVRHIKTCISPTLDGDAPLDGKQTAERIAFTSLLQSHGQLLLDLYLYTSYANYSSATRPAFTKILPWHTNYTVPPTRREAARNRTKHLGLDSLDLDTTHDDLSTGMLRPSDRFEAEKRAAGIPSERPAQRSSFLPFGRGKSVINPEAAARFKLDGLSTKLFDPLSDLLANKSHIFDSDTYTSLDCLALGYLSLMLFAPVPQAWLAETLKKKYPSLTTYTTNLRQRLLGGEIDPSTAFSPTRNHNTDDTHASRAHNILPWSPAPPPPTFIAPQNIAKELLCNIPGLSTYLNPPTIRPLAPAPPPTLLQTLSSNLSTITAITAGVLSAVAVQQFSLAKRHDNLVFTPEDLPDAELHAKRSPRKQYGEAGDLFAALGADVFGDVQVEREEQRMGGAKVGEVEVEVEVEVDVVGK